MIRAMKSPRAAASKKLAAVRLFRGASFEAAWQHVVLPWFRNAAVHSWRCAEQTVVVTPFRSDGLFLKTRLLDAGVHCLGVRFLTAAELRELLMRQLGIAGEIASREDLRLLLSAAAETVATRELSDGLNAVVSSPDALLSA